MLAISQLRQNTQDGSTLQVVIDLAGSGIQYATAQNLGVYPENDPDIVAQVADYLGEDLNSVYQVTSEKKKVKIPVPSPLSVR